MYIVKLNNAYGIAEDGVSVVRNLSASEAFELLCKITSNDDALQNIIQITRAMLEARD